MRPVPNLIKLLKARKFEHLVIHKKMLDRIFYTLFKTKQLDISCNSEDIVAVEDKKIYLAFQRERRHYQKRSGK